MNVANSERENATAPSPSDTPPELAVVIPTLNERENVAALVDRLGFRRAAVTPIESQSPVSAKGLRQAGCAATLIEPGPITRNG
jgi:hypothetical protein